MWWNTAQIGREKILHRKKNGVIAHIDIHNCVQGCYGFREKAVFLSGGFGPDDPVASS